MPGVHPTRGFALLIVLWTLVLISLLVTQMTAAGRGATQLAGNLRAAARLEAIADGVVQEALFHLVQTGPDAWAPGPEVRRLERGGAVVSLRIGGQAGLVNPSNASPELLQALMRAVGVDEVTARGIAASIVEWRTPYGQAGTGLARFDRYRAAGRAWGPPGAPFQSMDELAAVFGMTPDILGRLAPHLSLFTEEEPDPAVADGVVRAALVSLAGGRGLVRRERSGARVVSVGVTVGWAGGTEFGRAAVVGLLPDATTVRVLSSQ